MFKCNLLCHSRRGKHERFNRCPNCYVETKHQNLKINELHFGEVLDKEIHKRK